MKKLITILLLTTLGTIAQTQVNLSNLTSNVTLGVNCSNSEIPIAYETTGDLNLNGHTLSLRNSTLKVNGNINGGGTISSCGQSLICLTGSVQNNPQYNSSLVVNCNVLSLEEFHNLKEIPSGLRYNIFDIKGRLLKSGLTGNISNYLIGVVFILKVEGYRPKKMLIKN